MIRNSFCLFLGSLTTAVAMYLAGGQCKAGLIVGAGVVLGAVVGGVKVFPGAAMEMVKWIGGAKAGASAKAAASKPVPKPVPESGSLAVIYKGVRIVRVGEGYRVPLLDPESVLDSLRDAKRLVDACGVVEGVA